jgi:hypothetical protein
MKNTIKGNFVGFTNGDPTITNSKDTIKGMTNNKQQTHTCVFEKSKTSNSNEAKCKYCNIVRYTIDVKFNNETYGGGEQ